MTAYVCCICMKSLDEKVIWEDTNSSHGNSELTNHSDTASDITFPLTNVEIDEVIFPSHFRETRRYGAKRARKEVSANRFAIVSTPCGHLYHLGCICTWMEILEKRGCDPTCAYCRHAICDAVELVYIYPVSSKLSADEDTDKEASCNNIKKRRRKGKAVEVNPSSYQAATSLETPRGYYDRKFWAAVGVSVLSILFYMSYLERCLSLMETDEYEEMEDDALFGTMWSVVTALGTGVAVVIDWQGNDK